MNMELVDYLEQRDFDDYLDSFSYESMCNPEEKE
jgi:hypothetical protein